VANTYIQRMRVALSLQQATGAWTNGFIYDAAGRLTSGTSQAGSFGHLAYTTFGEDCCTAESTARFIAKTAARYALCAAFCAAVYGPPTRPPLPPL
jgi:hypothetical protein